MAVVFAAFVHERAQPYLALWGDFRIRRRGMLRGVISGYGEEACKYHLKMQKLRLCTNVHSLALLCGVISGQGEKATKNHSWPGSQHSGRLKACLYSSFEADEIELDKYIE